MDSDDPRFWPNFPDYGSSRAMSTSGVALTPEKARTFLTFFACVGLRARIIGSLKCYVARDTGTIFEPVDHYLNALLDGKPNRDTNEFQFFEMVVHHLDVWGNFFGIKKRNRLGEYSEILQISDPANVTPYYIQDGVKTVLFDNTVASPRSLVYEVRRNDGQPAKIYPARDILHIANITQNGVVGMSQLGIMRETIGKYLSAQTYQADHFSGPVVTAAGVISHPRMFDAETQEESVKAIQKKMEAVATGGVAVLDEDMKYTPLPPMPMTDAQFIESQQLDAYMMCGYLGVPPSWVGLPVATSYNSLETLNEVFKSGCIFPLGTRISKTLTNSLLSKADLRAQLCIVFDYDTAFKADKKARGIYNTQMFAMGAKPNTIMAKENWPPIGEGGDTSFRPSNLVPITDPGQVTATQPTPISDTDELGNENETDVDDDETQN